MGPLATRHLLEATTALSAPDAGQRNSDLSNLIIGHSLPDRKAKVDLDS
jgi:hypothetical protein